MGRWLPLLKVPYASGACSFFSSLFSFPYSHFPSLPPCSSLLLSFFLSLSLSFSCSHVCHWDEYEDCIDLDGSDDDPNAPPHVSAAKPTFRRPSMNASASTSSLVMPSSSAISYPSGLPDDVISHLTHDELLKNLEFMKYVNTVEVLLHREKVDKVPLNRKSLPHLFYNPPNLTSELPLSSVQVGHPFAQAIPPLRSPATSCCPR